MADREIRVRARVTIPDDILATLPPRPYHEIRSEVRDCDLLLCSANEMASRLIRWATRSPWSHVAIAFRMPSIDRVLVLECVEHIAVRCVSLSSFITRTSSGVQPYPGRILLARHQGLAQRDAAAAMQTMSRFAFSQLGKPFSRIETLKIALRICLGRLRLKLPGAVQADDEYICSEYVTRCFEHAGLSIAWHGLGFIAPADIANDRDVQAVAQIQTQ